MDRKSIFLALFIFIIIIFSLYFTLEENPIAPPEPPVENEELPEEELEDVNFSIFNNQQQELQLESELLKNFKEDQRMELRPLKADVYSLNSDQLLYTLKGDFAVYYSNDQYLEIRGNVLIESDRYQIEAEELDYYLNRNYLEGRGSVKITGSEFNSRAASFNSDLDLRNLKLKGDNGQAAVDFGELSED
ncbi:LPS export ABC transporter protein LptC [Halanaerobium saccharolyticum]|uniref:LPS export ABC transporter protein LptC n=1 Tax=Halanaerobium saccharolyticum TaxID=43595 RepID=A0A2T5RT56_9FIRM|nr:LPS export ABC transporter periplasmic protein LptC [Halanaerobium saccharolyticum]PTW03520.1 LPS export ABC transporter protein LptC [Halanaerobium saccharolyticum]